MEDAQPSRARSLRVRLLHGQAICSCARSLQVRLHGQAICARVRSLQVRLHGQAICARVRCNKHCYMCGTGVS